MVHFVGAGSGAADLITVRGARLIGQADVIIYAGSLVNPELLAGKKETCEVHNSARMTLEEVISVIRRAEEAGKMTVRLHTGDPSIYGAIREQMDLLEELEGTGSSIQINSVGETDFIVSYNPQIKRRAALQWMKTAFVSAVSFCGAAFAIMTFNNDANVTDVFGNLYRLIMGAEPQGITVLEISYSVGLSLGILVFFNHFASWKITVDPTPIEVEMRLYEENLDKALIQNAGRKEAQTDVR